MTAIPGLKATPCACPQPPDPYADARQDPEQIAGYVRGVGMVVRAWHPGMTAQETEDLVERIRATTTLSRAQARRVVETWTPRAYRKPPGLHVCVYGGTVHRMTYQAARAVNDRTMLAALYRPTRSAELASLEWSLRAAAVIPDLTPTQAKHLPDVDFLQSVTRAITCTKEHPGATCPHPTNPGATTVIRRRPGVRRPRRRDR